MRIRIGGFPPRRRGPYQRPHGGNMSEIERVIHLIASMQILFGSRRGAIIPILILLFCGGGWLAYKFYPGWTLSQADQLWDSDVSKNKVKAIPKYKDILQKRDWFDSDKFLLNTGRKRIYERVIEYSYILEKDGQTCRDWILEAWREGLRGDDLKFYDDKVKVFFKEVVSEFKDTKDHRRDRILNSRGIKDLGDDDEDAASKVDPDPDFELNKKDDSEKDETEKRRERILNSPLLPSGG